MKASMSGMRTNTTKIKPMEFEEPLDDKALEMVESPMIPPLMDVAGGLYILRCVQGPPFGYPHLNFKFQHLAKELVLAFPCMPPFRF